MPGSFTYSPAAGTVLGAGTDTLSLTFTPTDTADYNTATATASIIVVPATPTVTWSTPASISYGTALTGSQLDAQASVPGAFAYSPAAGTVLSAGPQTLSITFAPDDSTDYATATATTTLNVSKATPTVHVNGGGVYDGDPIPATATVAGVVAGVDASPASRLEGLSPVLTYYAGSTATGTPIAVRADDGGDVHGGSVLRRQRRLRRGHGAGHLRDHPGHARRRVEHPGVDRLPHAAGLESA